MSSERHLLGQVRDFLDNRGSYYSKFATLDGSGVTESAIGTLSGVTECFIVSADEGPIDMHRMLVTIQDGAGFGIADYGAIAGGLANGIQIRWEDSSGALLRNITDPIHPVKTNVDWAAYCYDGAAQVFGSGEDYYQTRWTFNKAGLPLRMAKGDRICVVLHDTLTALTNHLFMFQGRLRV